MCGELGKVCPPEGIYPESMISCPKPYEKIAAAREGGREAGKKQAETMP